MIKVPVPLLVTQEAIVAEIQAEKRLVTANRELIVCFEKKIQAVLSRVWGGTAAEEESESEAIAQTA